MKRTVLLLAAGIVCAGIASAQAPEMQKFLPKEWEYLRLYEGDMTRQLTAAVNEYKMRLTRSYSDIESWYAVTNQYGGIEGNFKYSEIIGYREEYSIELTEGMEVHPEPGVYRVYEEKLQGHMFYYCVEHESDEYPTNMYLVYANGDELIVYDPVTYDEQTGRYETYLIPGKQGRIKAVCQSRNYKGQSWNYKDGLSSVQYQTLEKDVLGYNVETDHLYRSAVFEAPSFLYDEEEPLKYALLNAFDGDPSTSYVEDSRNFWIARKRNSTDDTVNDLYTKDNLLWIRFAWRVGPYYFPGGFSAFRIINGYASDEVWYGRNNRPRVVQDGYHKGWLWDVEYACRLREEKCVLADNSLDWQEFKFNLSQYFVVTDIYRGSLYNDTCIAELDFKYDGYAGPEGDVGDGEFVDETKYVYEWNLSDREPVKPIGWLFSSRPDDE